MSDDFFSNLQAVTSNIEDITFSRFATITSITGCYATVKEDEEDGLTHENVLTLSHNLQVGDKVVIGFVDNSIYNPVILTGGEKAYTKTETDNLLQKKVDEPINEGSNGQVLTTDGEGGRTWKTVQGGGSDVDIVTSWEPTPSDTKVPSEKLTKDTLDTKVDKVTGKGLSANDFTNSYKNTIDGLSTVATTGDYDDLTDKPTIPSKISDLTNDSDFIEKSSTAGLVKNDGTIDTTSYSTFSGSYNDLTNKPTIPTKTSDLTNDGDGTNVFVKNNDSRLSDARTPTSHNHDDRYYTESEMNTALNGKQDTLVSGTSIKTINNTSLLGSGNIVVGGGGNVPTKTSDLTNDGEDGVNPFVSDDDSRLSDARTPTSHTHTSNQVTDLINTIYPVGSIYMSVNSVNPATLFGGEWEQIKDKFLLSSGDVYSNGATGGSADAVVVEHTHLLGNEDYYFVGKKKSDTASNKRVTVPTSGSNYAYVSSANASFGNFSATNSKGVAGTGKNMPPYFVVNIWKRTA